MPELAEVEYYRKQWDAGLGQRVVRIHLHPNTRVFRGTHGRSRKVTMERARGITVEGSGEGLLFFQMDGELRQAHGARVQVQVAPAALPVLAPVGGAGK